MTLGALTMAWAAALASRQVAPQVYCQLDMRRALGIVSLAILVAACSPAATTLGPSASAAGSPSPAATARPSPSTDQSHPVGLIAIGHSGLTGEGTAGQYQPAYQNSWATGTAPEVKSVYQRLVAVLPGSEGHVTNHAQGGAVASALLGQAQRALQDVPTPALVIISTIDNDIRCDGTDAAHVAEFGAAVKDALDLIIAASPHSTILIVGQLGRPSIPYIEAQVAADPSARATLTGVGPCDFYAPDGKIVPAHFKTLTAIIQAYEDEEASRCAAVPQCTTDGGVRAAWVDKVNFYSGNTGHLNVAGQAAEAANIWPTVAALLHL